MSNTNTTDTLQDPAFYVDEAGHQVVWEDNPRFYIVRNGEMRIHARKEAEFNPTIIRYTDQLLSFGIKTDEDLRRWEKQDEEFFSVANNAWFEVWDEKDSEYYSQPYHELNDAIEQVGVLYAKYGNESPVE